MYYLRVSIFLIRAQHEGPAHERRGPTDYGNSRDYDGDGVDNDDSGSDGGEDDNIHPSSRDLTQQDSLSRGSNVSQMNGLRQV